MLEPRDVSLGRAGMHQQGGCQMLFLYLRI